MSCSVIPSMSMRPALHPALKFSQGYIESEFPQWDCQAANKAVLTNLLPLGVVGVDSDSVGSGVIIVFLLCPQVADFWRSVIESLADLPCCKVENEVVPPIESFVHPPPL